MSGPGYGPPSGYGPAPGYGPPGHPAYPPFRPPTNQLAIASLAVAFLCAPVGLGLGIAARRQIRRTGESGDGLALAGIIVGSIVTGIYVLLLALLVVSWVVLASSVSFAP